MASLPRQPCTRSPPPSALITLALVLPSRVSGSWVPEQLVGQVLVTPANATPPATSTAAPIVTNSKIAFLIPSVLSPAFAAASLASSPRVTLVVSPFPKENPPDVCQATH